MPRDELPYAEGTPERTICEQLRERWGDRSVQEVADLCGVSEPTARKWKEATRCPAVSIWPKIAEVFGFDHWSDVAPSPSNLKRRR